MIHPRDCRKGCEGDPLCAYTDLARVQDRNDAWPAMKRLEKALRKHYVSIGIEYLYEVVCAVEECEVAERVKDYGWTKDGYEPNET